MVRVLTTFLLAFAGSKLSEAEVVDIASTPISYRPPLGPPNDDNPRVFFDIKLGRYGEGTKLGRVVFELKSDITPKTAENFVRLSEAQYAGSRFHRIIPGFMCQGGDYQNDNGTGGSSIYGARFPDENFSLTHAAPGILSMANAGPNTNGSQFFICVQPTPFLDGKHVVFGQVISGFEVVKAMEACGSRSGETSYDVMISSSGVLKPGSGASPAQACLGSSLGVPRSITAGRAHVTRRSAPVRARRHAGNLVQRQHATRFGAVSVSPRMSFV